MTLSTIYKSLLGAGFLLMTSFVQGAELHPLRVGVAKVDITPKDLTGIVGMSPKGYQGVHDHLYARALVLDDGVTTAAIVALDLVEMGNTTLLRERIQKAVGIPADHIIINASHDHSAPRGGPPTPGTSSAEGRPYSTPAFITQVDDSIVDVVRQAKVGLQAARFGFDTGKVDVSVARYGYTVERGWGEYPNEEGFSDKTLWVVKFETPSGEPIAVLFNYAVHSNSMAGDPMIHGDIAGNAEKFVEHQLGDHAVALWSMGAAADAYPKFNGDMGVLEAQTSHYAPVEVQGSMIGGEVIKVAKHITKLTGSVDLYASARAVPCEMNTMQGVGRRPGGPGSGGGPGGPGNGGGSPGSPATAPNAGGNGQPRPPMQTRRLLPPPNPGDKLDIYLGLIRINRLAITGVSGEVGSGIYQHLKKDSPFPNTLMITLSNDRAGYIPDDANWDHAGNNAAFVRGCAEKTIVNNLVEMMDATLQ